MKIIIYILGFLIVLALVFWILWGALSLVGLLLKYLSIPLTVLIISVKYFESTKSGKQNIGKTIGRCLAIGLCLFLLSYPVLNFASSMKEWASEDEAEDSNLGEEVANTDKEESSYEDNMEEVEATSSEVEVNSGDVETDSKESSSNEVNKIILGSTREDIIKMFPDFNMINRYEKNVDSNAIKLQNEELIIVADFDEDGICEGVSFLSNNFDDFDIWGDGQGSYVSENYDELVELATGGKDIKIEKDNDSGYPVEIYIGNIHDQYEGEDNIIGYIEYDLFNDPNRRNMYDIFQARK